MSGQSGGYRLHLSTLNEQLTCKLCGGYFIDATTIIECLHSFCRSCIIKYLESNKYCPICEVQVHKSKPLLNIRPDHTLQDIVYKLVPGCYQNEMRCRREFYSKYPDAKSQASSPESRGEPIESHIYSLDEALSLSLEYYMPNPKDQAENEKESTAKSLPRRYLRCPAAVTVFHLQKLIRAKYGLSDAHRVDIMYKEEPLCGNYTLMDVMYIYHWRRKVPLHLSYRIFDSSPKRLKLSEDNHVYEKILSNTKVDTVEPKNEQPEKREWKEVQLKISETGVMSVTDISNFDQKSVSNGDGNSEELITLDKSTIRLEKVEKVGKGDKNETAMLEDLTAKENPEKSKAEKTQNIPINNSEALKSTRNTPLIQEQKKASVNAEENAGAGGSESQKENPAPIPINDSSKAVTTQLEIESESTANEAQRLINQSKPKNNLVQDLNQGNKNVQESGVQSTKKCDNRAVNTNNNLINTEVKAESQKENAKAGGKEVKNASTSVETRQNALSSMLPFQPKMGQVNNTYSKKIPKDKKPVVINSRKLEVKTAPDQPKTDSKPSAHFASTKSQVTATVSSTKLATTVVSSPHSTTMSTQTVTTFVSVPQGSCLFVSAPQVTSCVLSNSTVVSSVQNPSSLNKAVVSSPHNLENQTGKATDHKAAPVAAVKSDLTNQKATAVKNNNNNPTSSSHSLASIGLNVSTAIPGSIETNSSVSHAVQNLVSSSQTKNADLKTENSAKVNSLSEKTSLNVPDMRTGTQSLSIYSVSAPSVSSPRLPSPQTSSAPKRGNSQLGIEISTIYTVPPCPDAIPISLMKPTVRKHEIIAKGTNLNEICAKIGESSKEKIKAATRSKSEIPNLLKITKKSGPDSTKCIPNVPSVPVAYSSGNQGNANPGDEKPIVSVSKEVTKSSSAVSSSQSLPTSIPPQKACPVKKQSQPVGYKTLRDPPKSWNPTLSKNNYVAARNQAKEMQNQTQGASVSDGTVKPIVSKPAKIFKMRNMPRYLGNPASGVKPMYGVSNESKEKDQSTQSVPKTSLNMMTIDPKTLSPIVSGANSPIISPPPYSPNARNYQSTQFSREICRNPGSPISPRNSPINMLATNPFIPSPTLNTNPKLMFPHFPPPYPDTSRFPNPLIRSPIGIPSPSAFHNSLPASINKYQRTNYLPPVTGYTTPSPTPPTIQKILPSMHSSPKSPKSTSVNTGPIFTLSKTEAQLTTPRVENIALHLARKTAAQQERSIFNLSKTGSSSSSSSPASTNFQNLLTTTTVTLATAGYASTDTSPNVTTQTTARSKPQLEIKIPESDGSKKKSKEPETVDLESGNEAPAAKSKTESNAEAKESKDAEKKEKTATAPMITTTTATTTATTTMMTTTTATTTTTTTTTSTITTKINGEVAVQNASPSPKEREKEKETALIKSTETTTSVPTTVKEPSSKEADNEKSEKSLEINNDKVVANTNETKSDEAIRKTGEQIQGKKSDVQRNKPES